MKVVMVVAFGKDKGCIIPAQEKTCSDVMSRLCEVRLGTEARLELKILR